MPGEGTSWANYMMSTAGGTNSGASSNYSGSSNTNANAAADHYNQIQYEKSPEYLNNPENFQTDGQFNPYLQAATSLQAAGAVTSGALGGQALWKQAPRLPDGSIDYAKQNLIDKYDNVYYSSFALNPDGENPDAWSPTGLIATSKDPVTGEVSHHVVGGSSSHQGGGGGGGSSRYNYGYGYGGGGGGYSGGVGGYAPAHRQHQAFLDQLYKGRLAGGQEVQKMLSMDQKIDAANVLSGLSQGAQAFAMDPKARGIMSVLTA